MFRGAGTDGRESAFQIYPQQQVMEERVVQKISQLEVLDEICMSWGISGNHSIELLVRN